MIDTCPICNSQTIRVIIRGLPGQLCSYGWCRTLSGPAALLPIEIDYRTRQELFIYKGSYFTAIFAYFGEKVAALWKAVSEKVK